MGCDTTLEDLEPRETYEPKSPTAIEQIEACERSLRLHEALDTLEEFLSEPPEDAMDPQEGLYESGPETYLP